MSIHRAIDLYLENNILEANKLLESIILEKIDIALENKKQSLFEAKPMPYKDVHKMLTDAGFEKIGQDGTSHIQYKHPKTGMKQSVIHHGKEVSVGIVRQCLGKIKELQQLQTEQYRPVGFHKNATKGLKHHLRFTHPIQKQKKNRRFYKSLHNRLDRK